VARADVDTLAKTLIGTAHLIFADKSAHPTPEDVHHFVDALIPNP
jgi:hypothetical protein